MRNCLSALALSLMSFLNNFSWAADKQNFSVDQSEYSRSHELIDVGNGRKMNLYCKGSGSPVVVFDSGAGAAGWDWVLVHSQIAIKTKACIYDRAGIAFSDASARPSTSANAVEDLHTLLSNAQVKPPYILVGHSSGSFNVQLYTYKYPQEVVGLVLVDGSHEDQNARFNKVSKGQWSKMQESGAIETKECIASSKAGFLVGSEKYKQCMGDPPEKFNKDLSVAYILNYAQSKAWATYESEDGSFETSADQLRTARKPFGDLPVICLTRTPYHWSQPGISTSTVNAMEKEWREMHIEIARLSTHGIEKVIPNSGHYIQLDRPDAVIDAINAVIDPNMKIVSSGKSF